MGSLRSKKEARLEGLGKPRQAKTKPGKATVTDARKQAENKRLVQEWIQLASSPRVVKLPPISSTDDKGNRTTKKSWMPLAQMPQVQFDEMIRQRKRLRERIEDLQNNTNRGLTSTKGVMSIRT